MKYLLEGNHGWASFVPGVIAKAMGRSEFVLEDRNGAVTASFDDPIDLIAQLEWIAAEMRKDLNLPKNQE